MRVRHEKASKRMSIEVSNRQEDKEMLDDLHEALTHWVRSKRELSLAAVLCEVEERRYRDE